MINRPPAHAFPVLLVFTLLLTEPTARAEDDDMTCQDCHETDLATFETSVHGGFDCTDCHFEADPLPHDETLTRVDCGMCHDDIAEQHKASVHGENLEARGLVPPDCRFCHGEPHAILSAGDPQSPVHETNQARTCGECHANPDYLLGLGIRTFRPIEAYEASVHSRALLNGQHGATCSSCHTSHVITRKGDADSAVSRQNVQDTCAQCHEEISAAYAASIHGRAAREGIRESPVCTDCHGEHRILSPREAGSPVFATNIPLQTCGRCHGNLRLSEKYGLAEHKVPAYEDSYHGLASQAGAQRVAHCGSCHGVHDVLPSSDPRSHIHPDNLAATCGHCHPGAGTRFTIGPVHVLASETRHSVAFWVRAVYLPLIFVTIGGMLVHNLLDLVKKARHPHTVHASPDARVEERMPRGFRIAHLLTMISFAVLVVTGFALKYPGAWWARPFLWFDQGSEIRAWTHRVAGIVITLALVWHFIHLAIDRDARRRILKFIPKLDDLRELRQRMLFNLGLSETPPDGVKVGYIEKSEYWAYMWGSAVMLLSGLALWFENFTLRHLPGWTVDLATSIHFYEAILATLAILVWHFYWVIFDPMVYPMDTTWLTGKPPLARAEERGEIIEDTGVASGVVTKVRTDQRVTSGR